MKIPLWIFGLAFSFLISSASHSSQSCPPGVFNGDKEPALKFTKTFASEYPPLSKEERLWVEDLWNTETNREFWVRQGYTKADLFTFFEKIDRPNRVLVVGKADGALEGWKTGHRGTFEASGLGSEIAQAKHYDEVLSKLVELRNFETVESSAGVVLLSPRLAERYQRISESKKIQMLELLRVHFNPSLALEVKSLTNRSFKKGFLDQKVLENLLQSDSVRLSLAEDVVLAQLGPA